MSVFPGAIISIGHDLRFGVPPSGGRGRELAEHVGISCRWPAEGGTPNLTDSFNRTQANLLTQMPGLGSRLTPDQAGLFLLHAARCSSRKHAVRAKTHSTPSGMEPGFM